MNIDNWHVMKQTTYFGGTLLQKEVCATLYSRSRYNVGMALLSVKQQTQSANDPYRSLMGHCKLVMSLLSLNVIV